MDKSIGISFIYIYIYIAFKINNLQLKTNLEYKEGLVH